MRLPVKLVVLVLTAALGLASCASQKKSGRAFKTYSSATDYYDAAEYEKKTSKTMLTLYTQNPSEKLAGNECVNTLTRDFGFEYGYAFSAPGVPQNKLSIFFANVGTTLRLTGRNGFGWKRKVNKRIAQCKLSSGEKLD